MKSFIAAVLLGFSFAASALDLPDGSTFSGFGVVNGAWVSGLTWFVTTQNGNTIIGDNTTPTVFKGNSKVKSVLDLQPNKTGIMVNNCVSIKGQCDTRLSAFEQFQYDINEVDNRVTFHVGKEFDRFQVR